jgi:hypothetical protein
MNLVGVWKESFSSDSGASEMDARMPVSTARHRFPAQKISIHPRRSLGCRYMLVPYQFYAPHPSIVRVFSPDLVAVPDDIFSIIYNFEQLI